MKILIVEDAQVRIDFFLKQLTTYEVDAVKRVDQALKLLKEKAYDLVMLDHDLIGARTGSHLTLEWQTNPKVLLTQNPMVIIHSMNIPGGKIMENHLRGIAKSIAVIPYRFFVTGETDIHQLIEQLQA